MKILKTSLITLIMLFITIPKVDAAASLTTSASTVYAGNSFTITVNVSSVAAWNIKINVSGAISASNCNNLTFADASADAKNTSRALTATCTAPKTGTINVSFSGDTTTATGTNQNVSGSRQISVINKPVQTVTPKSSINYLTNLTIDGATISPKFDKTVSEYNVELKEDTTSIKINATKQDTKSSVVGAGTVNVTEGLNIIKVIVTAENGSKRTYTIRANVKEKAPIEVTVKGEILNVVRKRDTLIEASAFYKEITVKINDEDIPGYYGEITGYTLVGLKDSEGNVNLYVYDETKDKYELYKEYSFGRLVLYPLSPKKNDIPKEFNKSEIEIDGNTLECYIHQDNEDVILIYGMNIETKNINFYKYDKNENTLQRYDNSLIKIKNDEISIYKQIVVGLLGVIVIILLAASFQGTLKGDKKIDKKKKLTKEKNQKIKQNKQKKDEVKNEELEEIEEKSQIDQSFL